MKRNTQFSLTKRLEKDNWSFGIGCSYILWNPRGENYTGHHIFTLRVLWFVFTWSIEQRISFK